MKKIMPALFFLLSPALFAQQITWEALAPMPEKVTNNALATATVGGVPYVFSFAGIDTTKACGAPHLRSFRYNTATNIWETIPPVPDPAGGKIAAAASTVKNKIYVLGGYHVAPNCAETSSRKVHIYDPETNTWLPDGADLPQAIDDHVQVVWRDSLIYVVTGWSNSHNTSNVQIYDPSTDAWQAGSPLPGSNQWPVFGASGVIVGDTLYYAGGAGNWNGNTFPATTTFRKGYLPPDTPAFIQWTGETAPESRGYRMGATTFHNSALWYGGAHETYNFDGIAYNGSGGVAPEDKLRIYNPATGKWTVLSGFLPAVMDLRGMAKIAENQYIIAGGMLEGQAVTDQVFRITLDDLAPTQNVAAPPVRLFPNPASDYFLIEAGASGRLVVTDALGREVVARAFSGHEKVELDSLAPGVFYVFIFWENGAMSVQKVGHY